MINIPSLYEIEENNGNINITPYDISNITICGRKLEQVIQILNGLDLEKEKEMLLIMKNLGKWCELIKDDIRKQQEEAIKNLIKGEE